MNITQALNRLRKALGAKASIRDARAPSSPVARAQAAAERRAARELFEAAEKAATARREAVLAADPEYQRLKAARIAAAVAWENVRGGPYYRYTAVTNEGLFFSVKAEADNLAELVEKVEASRRAA